MRFTSLFLLANLGRALAAPAAAGDEESKQLADSLQIPNSEELKSAVRGDRGTDATAKAKRACKIAKVVFKNSSSATVPAYLDAADALYDARIKVNWAVEAWFNASCIVSPSTTQEVSRAIKIVNFTKSKFATRGGGHDFNAKHSGVDAQGVLIDLVNYKKVTIASDKKSVTAEGGARWGDVHFALNNTGISANGGRSPTPGIGGQTIGGGFGWFTSQEGTTATTVISAEVVLGNGTVVKADAKTNSELFWAIRGGGPNFGIIASFTYRGIPVDKVWFESRRYTADKNPALLNALYEFQKLAAKDVKAMLLFSMSEDTSAPGSQLTFCYFEPKENPAPYAPFLSIPHASNAIPSTIGTIADLTAKFSAPIQPTPGASSVRVFAISVPHKATNKTYHDVYDAYLPFAKTALSKGWRINYGAQPFSAHAVRKTGDSPLGLVEVDQDWVFSTLVWSKPEDDQAAHQLMKDATKAMDDAARKNGDNLEFRFLNGAYEGQDVLSKYGPKNLARLRRVSQAYDQDQVFQQLQNGGWLLRNAK